MPNNIKKFKVTYDLIPRVFSLKESNFLEPIAVSVAKNVLEHTEAQKKHITDTIDQIDKDLNRTCYVDFTGRKASQLKAEWLTRAHAGETTITQGVFPDFIQGNSNGASVSKNIHARQVVPSVSAKTKSFIQFMESTHEISFAYRTDSGQSAGFSFVGSANGDADGNHKGWIITAIQNTTGSYEDRKVTVLASSDYTSAETPTMIAMDTLERIGAELKAAINNDKVVQLVTRMFNNDGSLNEEAIKQLKSRITASINIDDRDRKAAQFNFVMQWLQKSSGTQSQDDIPDTSDIDFFKDGVYETHLNKKLTALAKSLRTNLKTDITVDELTLILKNISERIAHVEMLAEQSYKNIELASTYRVLARHMKQKAVNLTFDGTDQDQNNIKVISQLDVEQLDKKVNRFYATDPRIKKYYALIKQSNQKKQEDLEYLSKPTSKNFFGRHSFCIGFGSLSVLLTVAAIGFIAFGLFPPFTLAFITVGTAFAMGAVLSTVDIYMNEKGHVKKTVEYQKDVTIISTKHNKELQAAKYKLQNKIQRMINLNEFLKPDPHVPDDSQLHHIPIEKEEKETPVPTSLGQGFFSMKHNNSDDRPRKKQRTNNQYNMADLKAPQANASHC